MATRNAREGPRLDISCKKFAGTLASSENIVCHILQLLITYNFRVPKTLIVLLCKFYFALVLLEVLYFAVLFIHLCLSMIDFFVVRH
jgi:hypothetical protein